MAAGLYPVRAFFDFGAERAVAFDARSLTLQLAQDWRSGLPGGHCVPVHYLLDDTRVCTVAGEGHA